MSLGFIGLKLINIVFLECFLRLVWITFSILMSRTADHLEEESELAPNDLIGVCLLSLLHSSSTLPVQQSGGCTGSVSRAERSFLPCRQHLFHPRDWCQLGSPTGCHESSLPGRTQPRLPLKDSLLLLPLV